MITSLRALLAFVLLVGFYIAALSVVAASVTVVILPFVMDIHLGFTTVAFLVGEVLSPCVALIILGVSLTVRRVDMSTDSVAVSRTDAPRLWTMVDDIAKQAGTRTPTELRLMAEPNAKVTEDLRFLGLLPGIRRLYLGLPLMVSLTRDELYAVLGHELGHYARRHIGFGALVYRGWIALRATKSMFDHYRNLFLPKKMAKKIIAECRKPWFVPFAVVFSPALVLMTLLSYCSGLLLFAIFSMYAELYGRVSFAVRRRQEVEADAAAVEIVGKEIAIRALQSVYVVPECWTRFHAYYIQPARTAGHVPDDPFSPFAEMMWDADYNNDVLSRLRKDPPASSTSPFDSHPNLAERIRHVASVPSGEKPTFEPDRERAIQLLDNKDRLSDVGKQMFPNDRREQWSTWLENVATVHAELVVKALGQALAQWAGCGHPQGVELSVDRILVILESNNRTELSTKLAKFYPKFSDKTQLLCTALFALVGCALVRSGRARWRIAWTWQRQPMVHELVVDSDSSSEPIYWHIERAVYDYQTNYLRKELASLRVNVTEKTKASSEALSFEGIPVRRAGNRLISVPQLILALCLVTAIPIFNFVSFKIAVSRIEIPTIPAMPAMSTFHIKIPNVPTPAKPSIGTASSGDTGVAPLPNGSEINVTVIVVEPGDTLSGLACRYRTTVTLLQQINGLGTSTMLYSGQKLLVPTFDAITSGC